MIGFIVLFLTLLNALGQLFSSTFALPLLGHFPTVRMAHRVVCLGWPV